MKVIDRFSGSNKFLSNFYESEVFYQGYFYPTVEHAYQASKCMKSSDLMKIRNCLTPGEAKKEGRMVELPDDWESVKIGIMRFLLIQKFIKEPCYSKLLNTRGCELVEGNTWGDTFWGICEGKGKNHLGKLLMTIREYI